MLPTFIVIGAGKAGTTSLWRYLKQHPEVFMSEEKEVGFFTQSWDRGVEWYESHFADAGDAKAIGEASPGYARTHQYPVPERMAGLIPDVRLIYLLRDPIKRILSSYRHEVYLGHEPRPIERALIENPTYVKTSRYAFHIENYLKHFPREQLLLVLSDDLLRDRRATLRTIQGFIGVEPDWAPPDLDTEHHLTEKKLVRAPTVERLRRRRLYRLAARLAPRSLHRLHYRLTTRPVASDARIPPELEARLRDALRPDVEKLRSYLGPDFDGWGIG